jgi:uncharacterized protein (UPF0210 family)
VPPSQFYFNKISKFVKKTWQETIANIAPSTRGNITRVSSELVGSSNPSIIDIIFDIIDLSHRPGYGVLNVVQAFFGQPVT